MQFLSTQISFGDLTRKRILCNIYLLKNIFLWKVNYRESEFRESEL